MNSTSNYQSIRKDYKSDRACLGWAIESLTEQSHAKIIENQELSPTYLNNTLLADTINGTSIS